MAITRWNFPNGSNGDTLTTALAGATLTSTSGGTMAISTEQAIIGTRSAKFISNTSGNLFFRRDDLNTATLGLDGYFYLTDAPSSIATLLWIGVSTARSTLVEMTAARIIRVRDFASTIVWTGSQAVPLTTWIRVSLYATPGTSTGEIQLAWYSDHSTTAVEDSGVLTSMDTGSANFTDVRIGSKATGGASTNTLYIGSWAYDDAASGPIGPYEELTPLMWVT